MENEFKEESGVLQGAPTTKDDNRYVIRLKGKTFSGFKTTLPILTTLKGNEYVVVHYDDVLKDNITYHNLKEVMVEQKQIATQETVGEAQKEQTNPNVMPEMSQQESISRSVALKAAVDLVSPNAEIVGKDYLANKTLEVAESFLKFLLGDNKK